MLLLLSCGGKKVNIFYFFSGAGKTVSATHIMRYFATADDKDSGKIKDVTQGMTEVEEQIMGNYFIFS